MKILIVLEAGDCSKLTIMVVKALRTVPVKVPIHMTSLTECEEIGLRLSAGAKILPFPVQPELESSDT